MVWHLALCHCPVSQINEINGGRYWLWLALHVSPEVFDGLFLSVFIQWENGLDGGNEACLLCGHCCGFSRGHGEPNTWNIPFCLLNRYIYLPCFFPFLFFTSNIERWYSTIITMISFVISQTQCDHGKVAKTSLSLSFLIHKMGIKHASEGCEN